MQSMRGRSVLTSLVVVLVAIISVEVYLRLGHELVLLALLPWLWHIGSALLERRFVLSVLENVVVCAFVTVSAFSRYRGIAKDIEATPSGIVGYSAKIILIVFVAAALLAALRLAISKRRRKTAPRGQ